ncbi:MAG: dTMP kinase [Nitrospinota bacterium]
MEQPTSGSKLVDGGLLITFEGVDGAGKTLQVDRLARRLTKSNYDIIRLRDPGSTNIGDQIRELIIAGEDISAQTELSLFLAARAEMVDKEILPALKMGKIVILDRFNDSTIAYQGYGRDIGAKLVSRLIDLFASLAGATIKSWHPDLTFYLKISGATGNERIATRELPSDKFETQAEFQKRVAAGYDQLAKENPDRIVTIDGDASMDKVELAIYQHTVNLIKKRGM